MVTGTSGITCTNCGQSNSGGQFCVRCGDRLPDPQATTTARAGAPDHPWETPAEWNPDPAWASGYSADAPAQSWDEQSRSWGPTGGAAGAYTPPPTAGFPQGQGYQQSNYQQQGYQQAGFQRQQGHQPQGYHPHTPPPPATPPASTPSSGSGGGGRRGRTPLLAGLAVLVTIAVILGIVLALNSGGNGSTPDAPAVALNGEETKTPEAVLDDARVNLRTASSVHAAGNVTDDGQDIRLDLDFAGNNVKGVLTLGGNDVQIIKMGDVVYLKGDRDFYLSVANGDTAAVDAIGNKWLKATGEDAKDFNEFSLDGFADAFKANDTDSKLNPTLGREDFQGQPVVVLTQADGSRLLVANTGKAYPLRVENKTGPDAGQIDFSRYGETVDIQAPSSSEVLDLSEVG